MFGSPSNTPLGSAELRRDLKQQLLHTEDGVLVDRLATSFAWGPALLAYQDDDWMDRQRTVTSRDDFSERVCTRLSIRKGQRKVHPRWSTAIRDMCSDS